MSRWRQDPDGAAAEILRRSLDGLALEGALLLAGCGSEPLGVLRSAGLTPSHWSRRASELATAAPWPAGGPYQVVLLRLAKVREEAEMNLHAAASVLAPGGRIVLFGGNDEGIRSGQADLEALCGPSETLAARAHGRIVCARRPEAPGAIKAQLSDWRRVVRLDLDGESRDWVTYPGLFAAGALDEGTALLLSVLPRLGPRARVLDFGSGSGPIAASLRARLPEADVEMLDSDTVALAAAAENVPGARVVAGASLAASGSQRYDAILSNPPLHVGLAEDRGVLERLMAQAPKHLKPGGMLQMVVQRRLPLEEALAALFSKVEVMADNGRYRVWRAFAGTPLSGGSAPRRAR